MSAASIIWDVIDAGHTIRLEGDQLKVRPRPSPELHARIAANKAALVAYLEEHGSATPPHPFTALRSADSAAVAARGVCIACGVPHEHHGQPPLGQWRLVDDPDVVEVVAAYGEVRP